MTQPELATNVADGVLVRVRAGLPEFTGALRRVAEQVLGDPAAAARATIVELAERSGTSPATVTRFCRALGFEGYAELRLGIAGETGRAARQAGWAVDIGREIQPEDSLERVLHQIMAADSRALGDTSALLDLKAVARAADAITASRRVDIYGISGSALVGAEMQLCLHRIGLAAWSWTAAVTCGWQCPVAVTAMPAVKSRKRLPSTSSMTAPLPRATTSG